MFYLVYMRNKKLIEYICITVCDASVLEIKKISTVNRCILQMPSL